MGRKSVLIGLSLILAGGLIYIVGKEAVPAPKASKVLPAKASQLRASNNSLTSQKPDKMVWNVREVNLLKEPLPKESLLSLKDKVKVTENRKNIMGYDTFYRQASVSPEDVSSTKQSVLLLHGMRFKSETWLKLDTLHLLAAAGHNIVAIDLPGYGESTTANVPAEKRGDYLREAITQLGLRRPILVSPSMSGTFSLPLLTSGHSDSELSGFVPVAPVGTESVDSEQFRKVQVPTLIISGELDKDIGQLSLANLKNIPNHKVQILPNARHPAYLDQPDLFHQLLLSFLKVLKKQGT